MLGLSKVIHKKTGMTHLSDLCKSPLCREGDLSLFGKYETTEEKVHCKKCLHLLEILLRREENAEAMIAETNARFEQFDDSVSYQPVTTRGVGL